MANNWITTYSGKHFLPLDPKFEDIDIEDIVHALSNICRFVGHCKSFYSVAQHSVLVSLYCKPENALYGLCHDLSEAYLQDIPTPIKQAAEFKFYRDIEFKLQSMIYKKLGLEAEEPEDVKIADLRVLATEMRDLMPTAALMWKNNEKALEIKIEPLPPAQAKELFLNRFRELTGNKHVR